MHLASRHHLGLEELTHRPKSVSSLLILLSAMSVDVRIEARRSIGGSNRQGNLWIVGGRMWWGMVVPGQTGVGVDFIERAYW